MPVDSQSILTHSHSTGSSCRKPWKDDVPSLAAYAMVACNDDSKSSGDHKEDTNAKVEHLAIAHAIICDSATKQQQLVDNIDSIDSLKASSMLSSTATVAL